MARWSMHLTAHQQAQLHTVAALALVVAACVYVHLTEAPPNAKPVAAVLATATPAPQPTLAAAGQPLSMPTPAVTQPPISVPMARDAAGNVTFVEMRAERGLSPAGYAARSSPAAFDARPPSMYLPTYTSTATATFDAQLPSLSPRTQTPTSTAPANPTTADPTPMLSATPTSTIVPATETARAVWLATVLSMDQQTAVARTPTTTPTRAGRPVISDTLDISLRGTDIYYETGSGFGNQIGKASLGLGWTPPITSQLYTTTRYGTNVGSLSASPDGQFLAFVVYDLRPPSFQHIYRSALRIMRYDGTEERTVLDSGISQQWDESVGDLKWSADGKQIAYRRFFGAVGGLGWAELHVVDVTTGQDRLLLAKVGSFCWSPDGKHIAHGGDNHAVSLLDLASGRDNLLWQDASLDFGALDWRPGGQQIAVSATTITTTQEIVRVGNIFLVDTTNGERHPLTKIAANDISWSPDGKQLVYLAYPETDDDWSQKPWLLDMDSGQTQLLLDRDVTLGYPAWSREGGTLLFAAREEMNETAGIYVMAVTDRSIARLIVIDQRWDPISPPVW